MNNISIDIIDNTIWRFPGEIFLWLYICPTFQNILRLIICTFLSL